MMTDWRFWSFLVACVALILSQLPPLRVLLKKAKLDLELYSRILLYHKVGNPNVLVHLLLRNVGGSAVRIKKIQLDISRDGEKVISLPAQTYIPDVTKTLQSVILASFTLKPEDEWSYHVNFLNYFKRDEDKKYRDAELSLKDEILKKKESVPQNTLVYASENLVLPFKEIFNSKYVWLPGEYKVTFTVITDNTKVNIQKTYRFILFESQSDEMKSYVDDYKTGDGIYFDSAKHSGISVELEEVNNDSL
ncbi:hypothetical protein [Spartinivicinus poritis]|uniref:Uncharacterized protein n=1 Tax=Spartinivicinus poritis TaxID=2994640 RepID=A0ABT5UG84_9GAMM|nr:hypothetical protein [Spartinivicinus sp. A2-2]MDE1465393.1 hypothetical protein [Spartinivicinus sp. A2-2]